MDYFWIVLVGVWIVWAFVKKNGTSLNMQTILPFVPKVMTPTVLDRHKKYLQIALNSTLDDAEVIIYTLPESDRIILEAGTPLIKEFGMEAVRRIKQLRPNAYIVADMKTMDRGSAEVEMARQAGASGVIALGSAPLETVNYFIDSCRLAGVDSMLDMMNVDQPVKILRKLKTQPRVVILHRGVDETEFNKNKPIPYLQIQKILSSFDVLISIAGGDTIREVQRAVFNNANIVVVWKDFYSSSVDTSTLSAEFLKAIK